MPGSSAIRAGQAFVELLIKDETVQKSLDDAKARLKAWGASIEGAARATSASFNETKPTIIQSTSAIAAATAPALVLRGAIASVGSTVTRVFTLITGSVTAATASLQGMAIVAKNLFKGTKFEGVFNKFLSNSEMTEKTGRWTRFIGILTGNSALKDMGNRIERMGLGASIVKGFQRGLLPGISATMGAAFRSAKSIAISKASGLLAAPFRLAFGGAKAAMGFGAAGGGIGALVNGNLTSNLQTAAASGDAFATSIMKLRGAAAAIGSLGIKVAKLAALIAGPALAAAHNLMNNFQSLADKGLISPETAKAAKAAADATDKMKEAVSAAWAKIAAIALPILQKAAEATARWANILETFVESNRETIGAAIQTAAKIAAIAAAVAVVGKAFAMAAPLVALIMSPLGMVAGGVGALLYLFPTLREQAGGAVRWIAKQFALLGPIVSTTMRGVQDALSGGSLEAATRVLWAGLNVAWLEGTQGIREIYRNFIGEVAKFGSSAFMGLRATWEVTVYAMTSAWSSAMRGIMSIWTSAYNAIARKMIELSAVLRGGDAKGDLESFERRAAIAQGAINAAMQGEKSARDTDFANRMMQIGAEGKNVRDSIDEETKARNEAAKRQLDESRAAFKKATDEAAAIASKPLRFGVGRSGGIGTTEQMGTFSAGAVGRQRIAGLDFLRKSSEETAKNTEEIAKNTKSGLAFT
jgi:hypothetical protein